MKLYDKVKNMFSKQNKSDSNEVVIELNLDALRSALLKNYITVENNMINNVPYTYDELALLLKEEEIKENIKKLGESYFIDLLNILRGEEFITIMDDNIDRYIKTLICDNLVKIIKSNNLEKLFYKSKTFMKLLNDRVSSLSKIICDVSIEDFESEFKTKEELLDYYINFDGKRISREEIKNIFYNSKTDDEKINIFLKYLSLTDPMYKEIINSENISYEVKKKICEDAYYESNILNAIFETKTSNEFVDILKKRITKEELVRYISERKKDLQYIQTTVKIFDNFVNNFGADVLVDCLEIFDDDYLVIYKNIYKSFNSDMAYYILTNIINSSLVVSMNEKLEKKYDDIKNNLLEIIKRDGDLSLLKKYLDYRNIMINDVYVVSFYKACYEYLKYNDICKNVMQSGTNDMSIISKYKRFINYIDNINVSTYEELLNIDLIEKNMCESYDMTDIKNNLLCLIFGVKSLDEKDEILKLINYIDEDDISYDIKNIIDIINKILLINDPQELHRFYNLLLNSIGSEQFEIFRLKTLDLKNDLINEYKRQYEDKTSKYFNMSDDEINNTEGIEVSYIDGIRVIYLNGVDFNFIVSGINSSYDPNYFKPYRCCSYINQSYLYSWGRDDSEDCICKVNIFDPNDVLISSRMAPCDLGWKNDVKHYNETFHSPDDLIAFSYSSNDKTPCNEIRVLNKRVIGDTVRHVNNEVFLTGLNINSSKFNEMIQDISNRNNTTVIAYNNELYKARLQEKINNFGVLLNNYYQSLDINLLKQLLTLLQGNTKEKDKFIINLCNELKNRINDTFDLNVLKKNINFLSHLNEYTMKDDVYISVAELLSYLKNIYNKKVNDLNFVYFDFPNDLLNIIYADKNNEVEEETSKIR